MTDLTTTIAKLERLMGEADPQRPWMADGCLVIGLQGFDIATTKLPETALFIANARNCLPALIAAVREVPALRAERDRLAALQNARVDGLWDACQLLAREGEIACECEEIRPRLEAVRAREARAERIEAAARAHVASVRAGNTVYCTLGDLADALAEPKP